MRRPSKLELYAEEVRARDPLAGEVILKLAQHARFCAGKTCASAMVAKGLTMNAIRVLEQIEFSILPSKKDVA